MKEPCGEGVASHTGPESCVDVREGVGEALTGVRAGRVWSRERREIRDADVVRLRGRPHRIRHEREADSSPARSKTPCMHGRTSHGTREIPCLIRKEMASGSTM